jgi:hypothetical protein
MVKIHFKQLAPFSEEWLAAMEACGEVCFHDIIDFSNFFVYE